MDFVKIIMNAMSVGEEMSLEELEEINNIFESSQYERKQDGIISKRWPT